MTKEEIIRRYEPYPNKAEVNVIGKMMDEYAKEVAIGFIEYHDKVRREESIWFHRECEKLGGMFSMAGKDINEIFDDYINKRPIKSYLAPEGIDSEWFYNDKGKLIHSSEKSKS